VGVVVLPIHEERLREVKVFTPKLAAQWPCKEWKCHCSFSQHSVQ